MRVITNWSKRDLEVREIYLDISWLLVRKKGQFKNVDMRGIVIGRVSIHSGRILARVSGIQAHISSLLS